MADYHIHTDAAEPLLIQLVEDLARLGFWNSPFEPHTGHEHGDPGFEPIDHRTWKSMLASDYRDQFGRTIALLEKHHFSGYCEGEYLLLDEAIQERSFTLVESPFRIERISLPSGQFRETELHVVFDRDRSDPRVSQILRTMGFHLGYIPKDGWVAEIRTIQGSKRTFQQLTPGLRQFLGGLGGIVNGSIKEERVLNYWLSRPDVSLPPVVGKVIWTGN